MAEDPRRLLSEEVAAFLFNEFTHLLSAPYKLLHDLGEKVEVATPSGTGGLETSSLQMEPNTWRACGSRSWNILECVCCRP